MRKVKFRGKFFSKWIYGSLIQDEYSKDHFGRPKIYYLGNGYDVDPKTVGQFTGFYDKNGVEIYEGDIIKTGETLIKIQFVKGVFSYYLKGYGVELPDLFTELSEVIGNIYDDLELLTNE